MPHVSAGDVVATREALQELVRTDGWQLFLKHVRTEWQTDGYVSRMGRAINSGSDVFGPKVVHEVAQEIQRICQWPTEKLAELKGQVE